MSEDSKRADDYRPIPCGLYSQYEVAILHRTRLRLQWRDGSGSEYSECVVPLDLQTRDHCEYLIAEGGAGEAVAIRLDQIFSLEQEQP